MATRRRSFDRRHLHEQDGDEHPSRPGPTAHRKDLQLCRQVAERLQLTLGDCGDDLLRDLHVVQVVPAPDATQLLVIVGPGPGESGADPHEVVARLKARAGALRAEVARAITRKRAPALLFDCAIPTPRVEDDR
jgi:ribosome-binding factor A